MTRAPIDPVFPADTPVTAEWSLAADCHNLLGEGPWWDARTGTLLRVDIAGRLLQRYDPSSGRTVTRELDQMASAVVARGVGGLAMAMEDGVWVTDTDAGFARRLAAVEADDPQTRMNDATASLLCGPVFADARPRRSAVERRRAAKRLAIPRPG